jgi:hypothetical protein
MLGVVLCAAPAVRAQKAASEKTPATLPEGTISGRVISQGGETISGATAFASPIGMGLQPRSAAIDSTGSFKFDALAAGVYAVSAYLPGFVPAPALPDEPRRYYRPGDSVTLTLIKGGVITGTVTSATNGPVVAAAVRGFRVKDENGQPEPFMVQPRERPTDDRGIYRLYGLMPGTYVISAGGPARSYGGLISGAYDNDVPTYAPSSGRDTAMEVVVHSGEEITADIQYHGEPGHVISGTLAGLVQPSSQGMGGAMGTITLADVRSHAVVTSTGAGAMTNNTFAFSGVPDGDYEVLAQQYLQSRDLMISDPRRLKVRGADINGVSMSLAPLASIAGRVVLESNPPADCVKGQANALQETVISARRFTPEPTPANSKTAKTESIAEVPLATANQAADGVPDPKGDFALRNLHRGPFHIDAQLPGTGWYLRSIALGPPSTTAKPSDPNIPRDGLTLKPAEKVTGLTVIINEGAASLRGHISAGEGQRAPAGLRVYLVPAERESADNVLRFFEAAVDTNGGFALDNLAPGRYWLIARAADNGEPAKVKPIRQESALRARVLREAEALKKEISFKPCEQTIGYVLPWTAAAQQ